MSERIGPRQGWEDHGSGTIRIEVDWESWAHLVGEKYTEPEEQGALLANAIAQDLRHGKAFDVGPDFAIHEVRYYGPVSPGENPTTTFDIGRLPAETE